MRAPATKHLRGVRVRVRALLGAALLVAAADAEARALAELPYTRAQTFSAALRYLRVDLGYEVTEKDADAAYLLFSYAAPEKDKKGARAHGAIEVVQREEGVRLFVSLPQLPSYHEEVLKQGLVKKLQAEYGEPVRDKPAPSEKNEKKKRPPEQEGEAPEGEREARNGSTER